MKIFLTDDFKNSTILAEKGIRCVLRGFALVKDTKGWMKKLYGATSSSGNLYDFEAMTLEELQQYTTLVTDEDKHNEDLLDNLFDITYEPCLEIQTPTLKKCPVCNGKKIVDDHMCFVCDGTGKVPNSNEKGTVLGGEKFGTYKIRINAMRNNKTENGLKGTYRAIALIGEKYIEDGVHVISTHKSYIGIIIYFDGQDMGNGDNALVVGGAQEDENGLHINGDTAFTLNFQFSLSQMHLVNDPDAMIEIDPEYQQIMQYSNQKDQTTTQIDMPGIFLVPSGMEYSHRVELEVGKNPKNEGIAYIDKTFNMIPDTYKNNNIFNVTPRFNIFDEHNDKFVKPLVMLSHGASSVSGEFINQSVAIEYDNKYFAMNEKAPTGASRFDLFGGATKREQNEYDDSHFSPGSGYLRLVSDRGRHLSGSNYAEILSNANTVGGNDVALYVSDNNYIGENARVVSSTDEDNTTTTALVYDTNDFHMIDSQGITATKNNRALIIDSNESNFEGQDGLTAFGTYKASAFTSADSYDGFRDDPYWCPDCFGDGKYDPEVHLNDDELKKRIKAGETKFPGGIKNVQLLPDKKYLPPATITYGSDEWEKLGLEIGIAGKDEERVDKDRIPDNNAQYLWYIDDENIYMYFRQGETDTFELLNVTKDNAAVNKNCTFSVFSTDTDAGLRFINHHRILYTAKNSYDSLDITNKIPVYISNNKYFKSDRNAVCLFFDDATKIADTAIPYQTLAGMDYATIYCYVSPKEIYWYGDEDNSSKRINILTQKFKGYDIFSRQISDDVTELCKRTYTDEGNTVEVLMTITVHKEGGVCKTCNGDGRVGRYGYPGRLMMYGLNTSSVEFNGYNNMMIGHEGLLSNFGHDSIVFGKYNACGNKEYDMCLTCSGTGRLTCTNCAGGKVVGNPMKECEECMGFGYVNYQADLCTYCSGTGIANNVVCPMCNGNTYTAYSALGDKTYSAFISGDEAIYTCPICNAKGEVLDLATTALIDCTVCSGTGKSACDPCSGHGFTEGYVHPLARSACPTCQNLLTECPHCGGANCNDKYTSGYEINMSCPACSGTGTLNNEPCIYCEGDGRITSGACARCNADLQVCDKCLGFGQNTCSECAGDAVVNCYECNNPDPAVECDLCNGEGALDDAAKVREYVGSFNADSYQDWATSATVPNEDAGDCTVCSGTGHRVKYNVQIGYPRTYDPEDCEVSAFVIRRKWYNSRYDYDTYHYVTGQRRYINETVQRAVVVEVPNASDHGNTTETVIVNELISGERYVTQDNLAYPGTGTEKMMPTNMMFKTHEDAENFLKNNENLIYDAYTENETNPGVWEVIELPVYFDTLGYDENNNFTTFIAGDMFYEELHPDGFTNYAVFDTKTDAENFVSTMITNAGDWTLEPFYFRVVAFEDEFHKCTTCGGTGKSNAKIKYKCPKCTDISEYSHAALFNKTTIWGDSKGLYTWNRSHVFCPANPVLFRNYHVPDKTGMIQEKTTPGYHECELCNGLGYVGPEQRISYLGELFEQRYRELADPGLYRSIESEVIGYNFRVGPKHDFATHNMLFFGEEPVHNWQAAFIGPTSGLSSCCPKCSTFFNQYCRKDVFDMVPFGYLPYDEIPQEVKDTYQYGNFYIDQYHYDTYSAKSVFDKMWKKYLDSNEYSLPQTFLEKRGVDRFCDSCNFNGKAQYNKEQKVEIKSQTCNECDYVDFSFTDKLGRFYKLHDKCPNCEKKNWTTPTTAGQRTVTIDGRGIIDCPTCVGGKEPCDKCNQVKHWLCTTCGGDQIVDFQPTIAYEDGKVVAVGDGYFYKNLMLDSDKFDMYKDYINIKPENNCDLNVGQYIKRMNLFSVENNGLLMVHNNNYDEIPDPHVKHELASDFFAVRGWAKYNDLQERFANLQNGCYAPDAIYFTKRTAHNEEWKLRIRELDYLLNDSYIKTNASMLKTAALNQAIYDFHRKNTTFLLRLGPIIYYSWKGRKQITVKGSKGIKGGKGMKGLKGAKGRKGMKGFKGMKGVNKIINQMYVAYKGQTLGIKGSKGMFGLKGLKGTPGYENLELHITGMRYKFYIADILAAVQSEFGKFISNTGNLGKNPETYTFYCLNGDPSNNLYFKGIRLRKMASGNYQTLNSVKGIKPGYIQRIVYKDNGYNGEYGVMNFKYAYNNRFLA